LRLPATRGARQARLADPKQRVSDKKFAIDHKPILSKASCTTGGNHRRDYHHQAAWSIRIFPGPVGCHRELTQWERRWESRPR